jgi:hypothetical protein
MAGCGGHDSTIPGTRRSLKQQDHGTGPPGKKQGCASKLTRAMRARGMTQVVEHLPSKYEVLSLNPSAPEKKKKEKIKIFPHREKT